MYRLGSWPSRLARLIWLGLVCLLFPLSAQAGTIRDWRSLKKAWPQLWFDSGTCKVKAVIDGDTVHVICRGNVAKLRLVGIDTPETKHPFKPVEYYGPQASKRAKALMPPGTLVRLAYQTKPKHGRLPRGKYGRVLAYLFLPSGTMFNAKMVQEGYALAYKVFTHPYMNHFINLQDSARRNRQGMWTDPASVLATNYQNQDYRKKKRYCILKEGRKKRFQWVVGNTKKKFYIVRQHPAYFKTNPETRQLFCSVKEAKAAGYVEAPPQFMPNTSSGRYIPSKRYRNQALRQMNQRSGVTLNKGKSSRTLPKQLSGQRFKPSRPSQVAPVNVAAIPPGSVLVLGNTKHKTFRIYQPGTFRIFRSAEEARAAGYKLRRKRRYKRRKSTSGSNSAAGAAPSNLPGELLKKCGGKPPVVGNRRSKVYRTPEQKSYKRALKSRNATFFCSEKEATGAGYRRAKR